MSDASRSSAPPLLVVVGPTASGKTELALELCERVGGEIVSADSVQVYRHFDVGTGKPSASERARAVHHLIDVVEPHDAMDAALWATLADAALEDIAARGRRAIVCGGTFLWIRALLFGLAKAPPASEVIRARHRAVAEAEGRAALHAELAKLDREHASRLAPNDLVRVSRALEVYELTGVPMSRWQSEHGFRTPRRDARLIGVARSKPELDLRILTRAESMLDAGFVEEVRALQARGHGSCRAMGSIGYKQVHAALAQGVTPDRELLCQAIVRATRVFARRQRTWLREQPVQWVAAATEVPLE